MTNSVDYWYQKYLKEKKRADKCCGGCTHFKYEITDGSGWCEVGDTKTYCGFGTDCNDFEDVETIRRERVARKGGLNMAKIDIEKEVREYISKNGTSLEEPDEFLTTLMQLDDMVMFAKHFYELGLKSKEK